MDFVRGLSVALICGAVLLIASQTDVRADVQSRGMRVEYDPPKNPVHLPLYDMVKERRVLEKLREVFSPFQLPVDLTLKTTGCDGQANAWYARPTLTICYEYLDEIRRDMPKDAAEIGITPNDAAIGQFFYAAAHEMGHAVFDLLSVPVFGRPEDAADQFATYMMLQFGKADARRLILGAAHSYKKYVNNPTVTAPLKAFSDWHGAPAQRFYNLLCLAYGADPVLFADFAEKQFLPEARARGCRREYGEVAYAFGQLIAPHLDQQLAKRVMDKTWLSEHTTKPSLN
jgi:Putative metallopeptidase